MVGLTTADSEHGKNSIQRTMHADLFVNEINDRFVDCDWQLQTHTHNDIL